MNCWEWEEEGMQKGEMVDLFRLAKYVRYEIPKLISLISVGDFDA